MRCAHLAWIPWLLTACSDGSLGRGTSDAAPDATTVTSMPDATADAGPAFGCQGEGVTFSDKSLQPFNLMAPGSTFALVADGGFDFGQFSISTATPSDVAAASIMNSPTHACVSARFRVESDPSIYSDVGVLGLLWAFAGGPDAGSLIGLAQVVLLHQQLALVAGYQDQVTSKQYGSQIFPVIADPYQWHYLRATLDLSSEGTWQSAVVVDGDVAAGAINMNAFPPGTNLAPGTVYATFGPADYLVPLPDAGTMTAVFDYADVRFSYSAK